MKQIYVISILLAVFTIPANATVYLVNPSGTGDFPTIQAAIADEGVVDGDVIELADGVYMGSGNRDIEFLGKAITVRSENGDAASCIIDCSDSRVEFIRGFYVRHGEGPNTRIENLTIRNGIAGGDD